MNLWGRQIIRIPSRGTSSARAEPLGRPLPRPRPQTSPRALQSLSYSSRPSNIGSHSGLHIFQLLEGRFLSSSWLASN